MTYTEIRQTIRNLDSIGFCLDEWRDVLEECDSEDFTVAGWRFIAKDSIDEIMQDELASDEYVLGGFNAWFIADILDMPVDAVEKIQKAEAFEALGAMLSKHIEEVQANYVRHDGYGHHFASYDGEEHEIEINGRDYYAFRC